MAEVELLRAEVARLKAELEAQTAKAALATASWKQAEEEVVRLQGRLEAALTDAVEGLEEMLSYCPDFFRHKHDLDGYVKRARAAVAGTE